MFDAESWREAGANKTFPHQGPRGVQKPSIANENDCETCVGGVPHDLVWAGGDELMVLEDTGVPCKHLPQPMMAADTKQTAEDYDAKRSKRQQRNLAIWI